MKAVEAAAAGPATARSSSAERTYWALLFGLPAVAAVLPITSGLWLDETGTYWITRGGFFDVVRRCTFWPQSILYSMFMLALDAVVGHSEIVFRFPSVVATIGAGYALYRTARDEFGREIALTSSVLLAATPGAMFAACDARPYAFGLLSITAALLLLLRWSHTGKLAYGLAYAVAAALIPHFHLLFTPVLGAHAVSVFVAIRRKQVSAIQIAIVLACFTVLTAPLAPQFLSAASTSVTHSPGSRPDVGDLAWSLIPVWIVLPTLCVAMIALIAGSRACRIPSRMPSPLLALLFASAVLPQLTLWGISVSSRTQIFVPRYLLSAAPADALLFALVLASPKWVVLRRSLLALAVVTGLYGAYAGQYLFNHAGKRGDYRTALAFVERNTVPDSAPVLVRSQYVESDFMNWRSARISDDVLFSPLGYYKAKATFLPLPLSMTPEVEPYLRALAASQRARDRRFLLMSFWGPRPLQPFLDILRASLPGWRETEIGNFKGILVYEFRPQQAD